MQLTKLVSFLASAILVVADGLNAYDLIRNTLGQYPLAIDSKNFTALSLVFTTDIVANYSDPIGVISGLPTVEQTLAAILAPVTTQHALSTQVIDLTADNTASTTT